MAFHQVNFSTYITYSFLILTITIIAHISRPPFVMTNATWQARIIIHCTCTLQKTCICFPFRKSWPELQIRVTSKRAKIHKTIYLNYAMIWNVLYSLRVFSIFSHGRLTVADLECVYNFASILNFRSFSICKSAQLFWNGVYTIIRV